MAWTVLSTDIVPRQRVVDIIAIEYKQLSIYFVLNVRRHPGPFNVRIRVNPVAIE